MAGKKVLDVGLGAAANAIAALERHEHIEIVSLERDLDALSLALRDGFPYLEKWRAAALALLRDGAWSEGGRKWDAARRRRARDPHRRGLRHGVS